MAATHTKDSLLAFFAANGISYQLIEHPPLFSVEDSSKYGISIEGADTKNLFLRQEKGGRIFLVSIPHHKRADLKALGKLLECGRLTFGEPELMKECLGVTPGAVTLLGMLNDSKKQVEIVIDEEIWSAPQIQMHPLVNTATAVLKKEGLEKVLTLSEHTPRIVAVPSRP